MKRVLFISSLFLFLYACNSGDKTSATTSKETPEIKEKAPDLSSNPDYQKGLALIAKNDCLTCHSVADKIQGPAYRDVANKYAGMGDTIVSHLADKIISGGTGVWGDIPMIPHATVSKEDAEAMVKYILLLKD